jgi:hypothetical protein
MGDADGIGTALSGGIFASVFDRGERAGAKPEESAGHPCLNCGTVRAGPFCQQCGQNGHIPRHIATIAYDFINDSFYFEGKLWRTLPLLAWRPGVFTRRYIAGERVKFVAPLALFLFAVFLFFAAISQLNTPDFASAAKGMAKAKDQISGQIDKAQDKLDDLKEKRSDKLEDDPKANVADLDKQITDVTSEIAALKIADSHLPSDLPGTVRLGKVNVGGTSVNLAMPTDDPDQKIKTGVSALDAQIDHVRRNPDLYTYKLQDAASKFSWALIPISVPFIWLLFFWRRDVGLYDHAIFAFHSLTFMLLMTVALIGLHMVGVGLGWLWTAFILIPPVHMYRHLKQAYGLGRFGALWRTGSLLLMTSITALLFFILLLWVEAT